jgi:hypothetical protein
MVAIYELVWNALMLRWLPKPARLSRGAPQAVVVKLFAFNANCKA